MDFIRYAEGSAALLNADLSDVDGLTAHLAARPRVQARATDVQAWPAGDMATFISQLHASGYTKHLPVQVIADPI